MYDELPLHTVNDVLDHAAQRFGDRIALVDGPSRYTFRDLHAQVLQASDGLRALGVRPGDRVALWLPNRVEWCVAFYAAVRAGAIVVPLNTGLSVPEATYQLAQSGSTVVVTADKYRSRRLAEDALAISAAAGGGLRVVVVGARVPDGALSWRVIASAPGRSGAGRPEKRVTARSKLPQKKWTGLALPMNRERNSLKMASTVTRIRQNAFA